jgi:hypothetical protein
MSTKRIYKVYYNGSKASTSTYFYTQSAQRPWSVRTRAVSAKQARWLVLEGILADKSGLGIVSVDHSWGPAAIDSHWPFRFDISEVGNGWGL